MEKHRVLEAVYLTWFQKYNTQKSRSFGSSKFDMVPKAQRLNWSSQFDMILKVSIEKFIKFYQKGLTKPTIYDIINLYFGCLCKSATQADCKSVPSGLGVRVPRHPFSGELLKRLRGLFANQLGR